MTHQGELQVNEHSGAIQRLRDWSDRRPYVSSVAAGLLLAGSVIGSTHVDEAWDSIQSHLHPPEATTAPTEVKTPVQPGVIARNPVEVVKLDCFTEPGRESIKPTGITVHYTVDVPDGTAQDLCDFMQAHKVSVQFNVDKNGVATLLTRDPAIKTGHEKGANDYNIGIEISGRNEADLLKRPKQYATVANLVMDLMERYDIPSAYNTPPCVIKEVNSKKNYQNGRNFGLHGHMESPCSIPPAVSPNRQKIDPGNTYMKYLRTDIARLEPGL